MEASESTVGTSRIISGTVVRNTSHEMYTVVLSWEVVCTASQIRGFCMMKVRAAELIEHVREEIKRKRDLVCLVTTSEAGVLLCYNKATIKKT